MTLGLLIAQSLIWSTDTNVFMKWNAREPEKLSKAARSMATSTGCIGIQNDIMVVNI